MTGGAGKRRRTLRLTILAWAAFLSAVLTVHITGSDKPAPAPPPPAPAVQALPGEAMPEDYENAKIEQALLARATVIADCTVTHYCLCERCCGKRPEDPGYGITASGARATPNVSIGVDPGVIPLGSDVLADYGDGELCYYRADDTGSGVRGNHIDVCVEDHETARTLGVKAATIYWIAREVA